MLSSTGPAAEWQGHRTGLYELEHSRTFSEKPVYRQRGGDYYLYWLSGRWYVGPTVGVAKDLGLSTQDLMAGHWVYAKEGSWPEDKTISFLPLSSSHCILQPSITLSSSGPANSSPPDYLGTFTILPDTFSQGRPVWRNSKGKVRSLYVHVGGSTHATPKHLHSRAETAQLFSHRHGQ